MEIQSFNLKRWDEPATAIEVGESPDLVELIITDTVRVHIWGEPSEDILFRSVGIALLSGDLRKHERDKLCTSIERATTTN